MTLITLRPDGTARNDGTVTGAASAHAALADDLDSSYVTLAGAPRQVAVDVPTPGIPAGGRVKSAQASVRLARTGGAPAVPTQVRLTHGSSSVVLTSSDINVDWGLPLWWASGLAALSGSEDLATLRVAVENRFGPISPQLLVYEASLAVTYVAKPTLAVSAPTGTLTTTNLPQVAWTPTLDTDGGPQTRYEARIFSAAQYGAGGFNPGTSTATVESGQVASDATNWTPTAPLADGTYRAYVRVAQTVNGVLHWSDWAFIGFSISVALPAVPTLTVTAEPTTARITVVIARNTGTATTDAFELQRSLDGGTTWQPVRQLVAGYLTAAATVTVYDYEAPNGVAVNYRARALHNYSGLYAASAWTALKAATMQSDQWWLKHPHRPALNLPVTVRSYRETQRAARQGVFQALGSSAAIVVSDKRGPAAGTIVLRVDATDHARLDALLDTAATLLLDGPVAQRPPGYVSIGDHIRQLIVDSGVVGAGRTFDSLQFVAVPAPPGDVTGWPA